MINKKMLRIALLLDNRNRELSALLHLQHTLEKELHAHVVIFGSIAEQQRMYFLFHSFKPHIIVISQIVENCVRDFASYVKRSGGMVFVLPAEVTVIQALIHMIINPSFCYNDLVDGIFLPGQRMFRLYNQTDISQKKLYITGSPKIDISVQNRLNKRLSRDHFLIKRNIPLSKKNIFIFTSFVKMDPTYVDANLAFKMHKGFLLKNNTYVSASQEKYISCMNKLCHDFPQYNIVHKSHPLEKINFSSFVQQKNFYSIQNTSLDECMQSIDLAIHWGSTVATECWIKKIPTIQYIPIQGYDEFLSEFSQGNPVVRTYKDLMYSIKKYIQSPIDEQYLHFQKTYLLSNYYKLDGNSAKRISHIIHQVCNQKKYHLKYSRNFPLYYYFFYMLEAIFGISISRKIISFILKRYNSVYAINNFYLK